MWYVYEFIINLIKMISIHFLYKYLIYLIILILYLRVFKINELSEYGHANKLFKFLNKKKKIIRNLYQYKVDCIINNEISI